MTPRALVIEFAVARDKAKAEQRRDLTNCWLTAAWTRVPKMPDLKELLAGPQTAAEQAEMWRHAADAFGLVVRKRDRRRKNQTRIIRPPRVEQVHG